MTKRDLINALEASGHDDDAEVKISVRSGGKRTVTGVSPRMATVGEKVPVVLYYNQSPEV